MLRRSKKSDGKASPKKSRFGKGSSSRLNNEMDNTAKIKNKDTSRNPFGEEDEDEDVSSAFMKKSTASISSNPIQPIDTARPNPTGTIGANDVKSKSTGSMFPSDVADKLSSSNEMRSSMKKTKSMFVKNKKEPQPITTKTKNKKFGKKKNIISGSHGLGSGAGVESSSSYPIKSPKPMKHRKFTIRDPSESNAVSELVTYITPKKVHKIHPMNPSTFANNDMDKSEDLLKQQSSPKYLHNECLLALRVNKFEFMDQNGKLTTKTIALTPTTATDGDLNDAADDVSVQVSVTGGFRKNMSSMNPKNKNKLRYVCITRSTNARIAYSGNSNTGHASNPIETVTGNVVCNGRVVLEDDYDIIHGEEDSDSDDDFDNDEDMDEDDDEDNDDYSLLFNPDGKGDVANIGSSPSPTKKKNGKKFGVNVSSDDFDLGPTRKHKDLSPEKEQTSFPSLVFMAITNDGTPDVRQILDLDQLVAIENVANTAMVKLVFQNGVIVELDCDVEDEKSRSTVPTPSSHVVKNRFLWSLLQIHAILCTSVVERNIRMNNSAYAKVHAATALPQLNMKNVDRAELQYISTVNGFLSDNPILCALLERQRNLAIGVDKKAGGAGGKHGHRGRSGSGDFQEEKTARGDGEVDDEVDGIAYDMIMGNFNRLALFTTEEEKFDAEEILNTIFFDPEEPSENGSVVSLMGVEDEKEESKNDMVKLKVDEIDTADTLTDLLQKRMRDLEAETCRRLIAWEDEKKFSHEGTTPSKRDTNEGQSLSVLFKTLDQLDRDLDNLEEWLSDKSAAIKPLTDDCREVEEVNREMEQQQYSYELLKIELGRLLDGLNVDPSIEEILRDPSSKMALNSNGEVDIKKSEAGAQEINEAGKTLKETFDKVADEGGVHLHAVNERVEGLLQVSNHFCQAVAKIIISIMKQTIIMVIDNEEKKDKSESHTSLSKSIRSTQKQFQTFVLTYIKLIEILQLLKPSILPSVRDAYANLVSEGILSKKKLKNYFTSLPGKSSVNMEMYTIDLNVYPAVALRSLPTTDTNHPIMRPAQAKDVEIALSQLLPVIAREAFFTAALFGLSAKHLSGREKKKNFDSAKKSVDFSSKHFKYYIKRICGIASEADAEGKKVFADPMLSLISSLMLNEAMDNYIDRKKKGGDHSLSLAYVRATILDLRKRVDRQWVSWVEEQIQWIKTSPGVPLNGKRAGVFTSYSRFPSYLDHVMICCKAGRPMDHVPNLSRIKVVTYYLQKMAAALFDSLHECAERETTDQEYAANVMRMENSYFFTQTIKQRGPELTELFRKQITAASTICKQSTDAYLGFMIKREFKSLHTLFASISRIRREVGDADVPIHVPRSTFQKTLEKECNGEILKEKIGSIYYRMEKHLSESGGLLPVAWKALVKVLYEWFGRWEKLSSQCYRFTLVPSASDVVRIAKQAAGISAKKIDEEKKDSRQN